MSTTSAELRRRVSSVAPMASVLICAVSVALLVGSPASAATRGEATPVTGDWNGDGRTDLGSFRDGNWSLRSADGKVRVVAFGRPGDLPIVGDWNGDGKDTVGVFRAGRWLLRNTNSSSGASLNFTFGQRGDEPVAGDWDGNVKDGIGVFRDGRWYLRNALSRGASRFTFAFGERDALPVVGDWNGNAADGIGVYRDGRWSLTNTLSAGAARRHLAYGGVAGDVPVVGRWRKGGVPSIGIARGTSWHLRTSLAASSSSRRLRVSSPPVGTVTRTAKTTATRTTTTEAGAVTLAAGRGRPWAPESAYNLRIPAGAVTDPNSAAMVAVIARNKRAHANLYEYADPVFDADSSSPQYSVNCTEPWGTCDLETKRVRIPAGAKPTPGTDGRMIVIDWSLREVCDFWRARRTSTGGWETSWGTCASIDGNGTGPSGGATGAGINALAGVVRTYEIRQGVINHALSFGTDNSCQKVFRHPATKSDGRSSRGDCIPEGARIQLDPSINVDALPGITPGEKAVAKALQTYGAYNRDNAGAPMAFAFESPIGESDPYPGAGFAWDYYDMPHIPWSKIRVLRSWNGS